MTYKNKKIKDAERKELVKHFIEEYKQKNYLKKLEKDYYIDMDDFLAGKHRKKR
jgi:hypothetical protein|tara:strand:- start:836 stop:997 length:162 start_codon:yes stop_codon:yes gene_type:complete